MSTSLGNLLKLAGLKESETPDAPAEDESPAEEAPSGPVFGSKVHVRISRKGRKGKTVTLVTGVLQPDAIVRKLRRELGVGARIEGELLVINGKQTERIARWLESQGAPSVTR